MTILAGLGVLMRHLVMGVGMALGFSIWPLAAGIWWCDAAGCEVLGRPTPGGTPSKDVAAAWLMGTIVWVLLVLFVTAVVIIIEGNERWPT